jgi:DNA (cytosine-5)-methyltransferase 1
MKYLSVCSGVEAATVAWHHMGWQAAGFSEIEKFPSEVLAHHYPTVTNFGDMTKYKEWNLNDPIGLLVGGTPCQSFSVAGLRKGLDDPRGNLALTYLGILDHFRPKWCVWENVPGVLSSGGGRDFGAFLGALAELGYGFAYRVLDAQNFGVAQRRRRVFVVGYLGDWRPAAEVLFESDCLRGDIKKGRGEKQAVAGGFVPSLANTLQTTCNDYSRADGFNMIANPVTFDGRNIQFFSNENYKTFPTLAATDYKGAKAVCYENHAQDSRVNEVEVSPTVAAKWGTGGGNVPLVQNVAFGWQNSASQSMSVDTITPTLDKSKTPAVAVGVDVYNHSETGQLAATFGRNSGGTNTAGPKVMVQQPIPEYYAHQYCQDRVYSTEGITPALNCSQAHKFRFDMAVRRLTPVECERLQGFPDNYTNIKDKCPDGPRYKAMGNSMAVPVMRWIGERINKVNSLL